MQSNLDILSYKHCVKHPISIIKHHAASTIPCSRAPRKHNAAPTLVSPRSAPRETFRGNAPENDGVPASHVISEHEATNGHFRTRIAYETGWRPGIIGIDRDSASVLSSNPSHPRHELHDIAWHSHLGFSSFIGDGLRTATTTFLKRCPIFSPTTSTSGSSAFQILETHPNTPKTDAHSQTHTQRNTTHKETQTQT